MYCVAMAGVVELVVSVVLVISVVPTTLRVAPADARRT
jgi:hypothetical protein